MFALSCFRYLEGGREPAGARCRSEMLHAAALSLMFISEVLECMTFLAALAWENTPCMKNQ